MNRHHDGLPEHSYGQWKGTGFDIQEWSCQEGALAGSSCMCLCKIMARPAITGKCGQLKRWDFFFFFAWAALQKALPGSRCYWSEFEEGGFFLSIVWYEPVEEAVCVLGRIRAWWQLGIFGFYYSAKPKCPMSMCRVSAGRAGCAQGPLGSVRNSVSHLPSVLRLPLVIKTGSLSRHSGVLILPCDPFLLPVPFITGIWLCSSLIKGNVWTWVKRLNQR